MRSLRCLVVSIGLAIAGCSSGTQDSSEPATTTLGTSAAPITTVAAATDTTGAQTAAPTVAETVAETAAPTAQSTTATPATITPEVLCFSSNLGGRVYFAYFNDGVGPVTVEANDDSILVGALEDDEPLVPTVFAPGRVSPAFWASAALSTDTVDLAWTVTGPDGVARTAALDPATPECTDELLAPTADDTRTPTLAFSYTAVPEFSQAPAQIDFVATIVGVPAASACAAGLEAQSPQVWTDGGDVTSVTDGPTVRRTLPFEQVTDRATNETYLVAATRVSAFVVDVCGADGAVSKSWPTAAHFERLQVGVLVCILAEDGRITMELKEQSVPTTCVGDPLPATGGMRVRSLPR